MAANNRRIVVCLLPIVIGLDCSRSTAPSQEQKTQATSPNQVNIAGASEDAGVLFPINADTAHGKAMGYIDRNGREIVAPRLIAASEFKEGFGIIHPQEGGRWQLVNNKGQVVVTKSRDDFDTGDLFDVVSDSRIRIATEEYNELATPKLSRRYGFADTTGKVVIPIAYRYARSFAEGLAAVLTVEGKWGYLDTDGRFAIRPRFDEADSFSDGLARVLVGNEYGYVDRNGTFVIPPRFVRDSEEPERFSEGLAAIKSKNKVGYIDRTGKTVIPPRYDYGECFSEGLAAVLRLGKFVYIDRTGATVIDLRFDAARRFSEGLASVSISGKEAFIDKNGAVVISGDYSEAGAFSDGVAAVYVKSPVTGKMLRTYIDGSGRVLWAPAGLGIAVTSPAGASGAVAATAGSNTAAAGTAAAASAAASPFHTLSETLVAEIDVMSLVPKCIRASRDARSLAFAQGMGATSFVVSGRHQGKVYAAIAEDSVVISPDGEHVAYTAKGKAGGWLNVIDDNEGEVYSAVGEVVFSPDGRHNAYMAERNGRHFIVNDDKAMPGQYDGIIAGTPVFSTDGTHMAYAARLNDKQFVVADGKKGSDYDNVVSLLFSPDGRRLAYLAAKGTRERHEQFLVVDGREGKKYENVGSLRFSPDSRHLAYIVTAGEQQFVVADGVERQRYFGVTNLTYSPDNRRLAYVAVSQRGGLPAVIVDTEGQAVPAAGGASVIQSVRAVANDSLTFSPDGTRLAYIGGVEGAWFVVVDGAVSGKAYDGIWDLGFSPGSRHVAWTARIGRDGIPVVDGQEERRYSLVSAPGSRVVFDSPTLFHFLAVKDTQVFLVQQSF
jgi:WD40 repeat protein